MDTAHHTMGLGDIPDVCSESQKPKLLVCYCLAILDLLSLFHVIHKLLPELEP